MAASNVRRFRKTSPDHGETSPVVSRLFPPRRTKGWGAELRSALVGAVFAAAAAATPAQVSLTTVVDLAQKNSAAVRLAQADVQKATAQLAQSRDAFIPSLTFDSGLPAFPEVGFTGSLPTIFGGTIQSLVFSMPQIQYIHAAQSGVQAAQLALKDAREQAALDASAEISSSTR